MKLTKEHSAALRAALPFLWDGKSGTLVPERRTQFICFAVHFGGHVCSPSVKAEILARLQGHGTLREWLLREHGITGTPEQLQAHRKAWMLLMIEEGSL